MTDLSALLALSREIAEKATPGPWRRPVANVFAVVKPLPRGPREPAAWWVIANLIEGRDDPVPAIAADAEHIAQAHPQAWLALLDVAESAAELSDMTFSEIADPGWSGCTEREEWSEARRRCVAALDRLTKVMEGQ